jgi:NAD(P)-dependent dehydrogenase (short-subunit alcohol dehydrogenase family)
MKRFTNKVALITGAGSGIGRTTALLFSEEEATVVVADKDVHKGVETVQMIKQRGGESSFIAVDVTIADDVKNMINETVDRYGRIDILFNNAGIEGTMANTENCSEDNWDQVISIDLKGVFLCMKYAITAMLNRGGGVIINSSSVGGIVGLPLMPAYCAAKGGVIQLTKTTALEYARRNIRVNCICPGVIQTPLTDRLINGKEATRNYLLDLHPMYRLGTQEEVAKAVLFLASTDSSFVTGVAFSIDGGVVAR